MKHYMSLHIPEQLSLVFEGVNFSKNTFLFFSHMPTGFKNVYDQQILKPAYPMAFFYVKVHNPPSVGENSPQVEPDQEFVYVG
jgi:hypothetical protein